MFEEGPISYKIFKASIKLEETRAGIGFDWGRVSSPLVT